mmetsp:Transcript_45186/g.32993  ORF Transcript_45186/g.32993 Transcript_45186/m.32993 type:complete len:142 (-) Transcript_45186:41-466(-)
MICDRASNSIMYLILSGVYLNLNYVFFLCFFLDFSSHWFQFITSALMKSESHKGKNKDENFLIYIYYNNKLFFSTMVVGAEACTVFLYLLKKVPIFADNVLFLAVTAVLSLILATKMTINVFQLYGGILRIVNFDRQLHAH